MGYAEAKRTGTDRAIPYYRAVSKSGFSNQPLAAGQAAVQGFADLEVAAAIRGTSVSGERLRIGSDWSEIQESNFG